MRKAVLVIVALVAACASAPKSYEFQKSWTMPCTYDEAWSATVELFAENGWPIDTLEKDSGIIGSEWVNIGTSSAYADCGGSGIAIVLRREGKFNVFVRDKGEGPVLTVNTTYRELRSFDNRQFYQDCNSTGALEASLHQQILSRTK